MNSGSHESGPGPQAAEAAWVESERAESTTLDPFFRLALEHLAQRVERGEVPLAEDASPAELTELVVGEGIPGVAETFARDMTRAMRRHVGRRRGYDRGFRRRLQNTWGEGLDRLWLLWLLIQEARDRYDEQERPRAIREDDLTFEALTRLHARASLIGYEILSLLDAGLASGAHARWRALHEVAVTAIFVKEHGRDVADRFLLHERASTYREALEHNRHAGRLQHVPFSQADLDGFAKVRDALRARFGPCYDRDYGWALAALGVRCDPAHARNPRCRATFAQLERATELDHWRPYYRMASQPIHASSRSAQWTLGGPDDTSVKMVGPSDGGLFDPGNGMAISFMQVSIALLLSRPTMERLVFVGGFGKIAERAIAELTKSQDLERRRRATNTRHWRWRDAVLRRRPR